VRSKGSSFFIVSDSSYAIIPWNIFKIFLSDRCSFLPSVYVRYISPIMALICFVIVLRIYLNVLVVLNCILSTACLNNFVIVVMQFPVYANAALFSIYVCLSASFNFVFSYRTVCTFLYPKFSAIVVIELGSFSFLVSFNVKL
jgi:hypothetical protein